MPQNASGSDSRGVKNDKREISQNSIEKALNPEFANIGFSGGNQPIANIGTDQEDDDLREAQSQGEGRRIEVLARGKYWQWRWTRNRGGSRYAGTFDKLPEARKRQYQNRRRQGKKKRTKARANRR